VANKIPVACVLEIPGVVSAITRTCMPVGKRWPGERGCKGVVTAAAAAAAAAAATLSVAISTIK
jgi:hypothetical protein